MEFAVGLDSFCLEFRFIDGRILIHWQMHSFSFHIQSILLWNVKNLHGLMDSIFALCLKLMDSCLTIPLCDLLPSLRGTRCTEVDKG